MNNLKFEPLYFKFEKKEYSPVDLKDFEPEGEIEVREKDGYDLHVEIQKYRYTPQKNSWAYRKVFVYNKDKTQMLYEYDRNYDGSMPLIRFSANGKDYLLLSERYVEITLVDITDVSNPIRYVFGVNRDGWCPVSFEITSNNGKDRVLMMEGCFWASPYDVILVPFTNPETAFLQDNLIYIYDSTTVINKPEIAWMREYKEKDETKDKKVLVFLYETEHTVELPENLFEKKVDQK